VELDLSQSAVHSGGSDNVLRIAFVLGNRFGGRREWSKEPWSNWSTSSWSALNPNRDSRGSDPNRVCRAWLYCRLFAAMTWFAIWIGSVTDFQGPPHSFGSGPTEYGSSVSPCRISILASPFVCRPLSRAWRMFLNLRRLFSRAFSFFISFF
jgi:hypothetical protein